VGGCAPMVGAARIPDPSLQPVEGVLQHRHRLLTTRPRLGTAGRLAGEKPHQGGADLLGGPPRSLGFEAMPVAITDGQAAVQPLCPAEGFRGPSLAPLFTAAEHWTAGSGLHHPGRVRQRSTWPRRGGHRDGRGDPPPHHGSSTIWRPCSPWPPGGPRPFGFREPVSAAAVSSGSWCGGSWIPCPRRSLRGAAAANGSGEDFAGGEPGSWRASGSAAEEWPRGGRGSHDGDSGRFPSPP